ncbi:hypothetical protein J8273_6772 [Carpediemonas membranifera]|uniref:Uncharacterized protein n=1 Tax=Carpediemonas membranifera TaxID=201153 RepID=A0A8J6BVZ9_9EUKA|nr:hypothetical protein J8273_6772 [Carpediemonas membranifera]|eukprot:KAG9391926.1 hypothetical protein J8273_6772 [Carpediemonas membranifera]
MLESSTVARFNTSESLEEDTMEDIDATLAEMDTFSELPSKRPLKAEAKWLQRVVVINSALPDSATKQRLLLELQARRMVLDLKDDNWSDATTELFQDLFNSTESKSSRTIAYCAAKARSKGRRKDTNGNMGGFTRRREHNNLCSSIPVDEREVVVMGKARRLGRGGRLAPSRRTYQANRHSPATHATTAPGPTAHPKARRDGPTWRDLTLYQRATPAQCPALRGCKGRARCPPGTRPTRPQRNHCGDAGLPALRPKTSSAQPRRGGQCSAH